jgi:hypothetical protein
LAAFRRTVLMDIGSVSWGRAGATGRERRGVPSRRRGPSSTDPSPSGGEPGVLDGCLRGQGDRGMADDHRRASWDGASWPLGHGHDEQDRGSEHPTAAGSPHAHPHRLPPAFDDSITLRRAATISARVDDFLDDPNAPGRRPVRRSSRATVFFNFQAGTAQRWLRFPTGNVPPAGRTGRWCKPSRIVVPS